MKLLYLSEHRSCLNYQLEYGSGFSRYELSAQECGRIDNDNCFCVLFLLRGELLVSLGKEQSILVSSNRMLFIPQREKTGYKALCRQSVSCCFGIKKSQSVTRCISIPFPMKK